MVDQSHDEPKAKRPSAPQKAGGTTSVNGAAKDGNGIYVSPSGAKPSDAKAGGTKPADAKPGVGAKADTGAKPPDYPLPDLAAFSRNLLQVATHSQKLVSNFMRTQAGRKESGPVDPLNVGATFLDFTRQLMANPSLMIEAQAQLWKGYLDLWHNTTKRLLGYDVDPLVKPSPADRRFKHSDWHEIAIFDYIKQSYLLTANWMQETASKVEGLDDKTRQKVNFYTRQFADAIAPTNFLATNPEVLRATFSSNGENLVKGLENLLADLDHGSGKLHIRQADMDYFKVGENIATAPGKVVFRNELVELLQFEPTTTEVYRRPLVVFPPWINKFYILDLQPKNSFIRWAVSRGYTVFVVSWVNPDARLARKGFEDYMKDGILATLSAVEKATGEREVGTIGYCIGGTLLGSTLAYMAKKHDDRIKSATFFAAQLDFTEAGELQVFIDDEQLKSLEDRMNANGGYLSGSEMAQTFNLLRANDLIWSYVVNNYMLGKEPMRFDLLYWNSDTTRMPAKMHLFYLREFYQKNLLAKGGMELGGEKLDLSEIEVPTYFQSSREDHIAPMTSVFKGMKILGGNKRFIVAGSGHIAGVINHPDAHKYQYWTNDDISGSLDQWFERAEEHPGSWWVDWDQWLSKLSGEKIPARKPGDGKLKVLGNAPGTYVQIKSTDDAAQVMSPDTMEAEDEAYES